MCGVSGSSSYRRGILSCIRNQLERRVRHEKIGRTVISKVSIDFTNTFRVVDVDEIQNVLEETDTDYFDWWEDR